jgi:hypothetical protein
MKIEREENENCKLPTIESEEDFPSNLKND